MTKWQTVELKQLFIRRKTHPSTLSFLPLANPLAKKRQWIPCNCV